MQDLVQPATLRNAAAAAAVTTLVCLPRLYLWPDRPVYLGALTSALGVCSFALWGFVFAWCPPSLRPVFRFCPAPRPWSIATFGGIACALLLGAFVDPRVHALAPGDYPASLTDWWAHWLFTVSMVQLFLCFAPLCFFHRLLHSIPHAAAATILFGIFLLGLQLQNTPPLGLPFFLIVLGARAVLGAIGVWLFVRGGPWPLWWWITILQTRELPGLVDGR